MTALDMIFRPGSAPFLNSTSSADGAYRFQTDAAVEVFTVSAAGLVTLVSGVTAAGDSTITTGNLIFGAASAKIIPGATSLLFRNTTDANTNLSISNAGAVVIRAGLTVTASGVTLTAGDLTLTAGNAVLTLGDLTMTAGNLLLSLGNATLTAGNLTLTSGRYIQTSPAAAAGAVAHTITPGAHTAVIAEVADTVVSAHTIAATGSFTTQRFNQFLQPTITSATALTTTTAATVAISGTPNPTGVGPQTITNAFGLMIGTALATMPAYSASNATTITAAASLYIAGAPATGGNVTVTEGHALWVDAGTVRLDGQLLGASGTVSLPGLSFQAEPDCGWYVIGTNNIGAAVNGALVLSVTTTAAAVTGNVLMGAVTIPSTPPVSAAGFKQGTAPAGASTTSGFIYTDGTVMRKQVADGTNSNIG